MEDEKNNYRRVLITNELFNTVLLVVILGLVMAFISAQMIFNYILYRQSETRMDYAIIGAIVGNPIAQEFLDIRKEKHPQRNNNGKNRK